MNNWWNKLFSQMQLDEINSWRLEEFRVRMPCPFDWRDRSLTPSWIQWLWNKLNLSISWPLTPPLQISTLEGWFSSSNTKHSSLYPQMVFYQVRLSIIIIFWWKPWTRIGFLWTSFVCHPSSEKEWKWGHLNQGSLYHPQPLHLNQSINDSICG